MIVLFFILFFSSLNSINFFSGLLNQKPGEVYLGTTHYYEDYFFYLNHFFQGARGTWLAANRYTTEPTTPSILFWPNVLLGKLGGFFGLSPMLSYNLSIIIITIMILITIYGIFRKVFSTSTHRALIGFLFATTATSLMNYIRVDGTPMWYPFQLWKTPNFALDRLGGVPHQLVQTLLFLLLVSVWFFGSKKLLRGLVLIILLSTLNPVMSAMFLVAAWMSAPSFKLILPSIGFLVIAWYFQILTNSQPHVQSKLWEASQQVTTTPLFLLLSIGPISMLGLLGVVKGIGEKKPIMLFGIILLAMNYFLFFTDIPRLIGISNSRVLFPAMYLFWGMLAAEGIFFIKKKFSILYSLFFILYSLLTIPTLYWEIQQKLIVKPEERIPLLYLPSGIYKRFTRLATLGSPNDVVLANPMTHLDAMIPALTGHTTYTGHPFATINSNQKRALASKFFQKQMSAEVAQAWLGKNHIRFVFFTELDGDKNQFQQAYPFIRYE